jgi:hypothetical protein
MLDFKSFTENLGTTLNALTPRITAPFAVTGWILLYVHARGWFVLSPSVVVVALIVGVLCTCLVSTSLAASLWAATRSLRDDCSRMVFRYRDKKRIEAELEYVIPNERGILGYLLAKNQKMFEVLPDGEEAATLIAKGFVVYPERQPPAVHRDICVVVPDHVWEVLVKHRAQFPCKALDSETQPWRTHWMAR